MAPNAITAAVASFVTGEPAPALKQKRKATMEDSLRGSARVDTLGTRKQSGSSAETPLASRAWQQQAWMYYDSVGEVRYSSGFIGACLSRCTLTVGIRDSKGNVGPVFDEDGEPLKGPDGNVLPGLE